MKFAKSLAVLAVPLIFLLAAEEKKQEKCPISGNAIKEEHSLNVNGKAIYFCCPNCPKAYAKKINLDPAKLAAEPAAACPISGRPATNEQQVIRKTANLTAFCCANCLGKTIKENKLTLKDEGPKKCPLSGRDAKNEEGTSLLVNGEKIYFCCTNCPKSYAAKQLGISAAELAKEPGKCPLSGNPAKKEQSLILFKSELVNFCCGNCKKKYIEASFKDGLVIKKAEGDGGDKKEEKKEKEKEKKKIRL